LMIWTKARNALVFPSFRFILSVWISPEILKPRPFPPRRYGDKFTSPKFHPRIKRNRRFKLLKPKWMK
jgi:hypothetical protein